MRSICSIYGAAFVAVLAATPAMAQVVIQTQDPNAARHEQRAMQDRADAHWEHQEAQRRAARGDYAGAAEAQGEARHDWHSAHHQERDAQRNSGAVVIGR
jgi:hypothetical protein